MTPLYSVAEITIHYKRKRRNVTLEAPVITTSADAATYLRKGFDKNTMAMQEQFVVLYLNQANKVLGIYRAATGGLTSTVADIRILLSVALKLLAPAFIVGHNHPSGNLTPSKQDEALTQKLKQAATLIDIKLLDHLILSPDKGYYSFVDEGLL